MGQYGTKPCATRLRRSVCTIFVLDDENGHNISSKKIRSVGNHRGRNSEISVSRSLPEGSS